MREKIRPGFFESDFWSRVSSLILSFLSGLESLESLSVPHKLHFNLFQLKILRSDVHSEDVKLYE